MRIMAVDYGDRRTGFAFSDATNTLVGDAFTVEEYDPERLAARVADECAARGVGAVVLGLPRNMDGSEGARAEKSRALAALIEEHTGISPVLWDERRSTIEAHGILRANGKREKKHKKTVDALAAALLLEGYLNSLAR